MKNWLLILILSVLPFIGFSQDEDVPAQQGGKIQERMREYIQNNLGLSEAEAARFTPVFIRYFREFVQTHRLYKTDRLILQQKIVELRLRFRGEFRQVLDEPRANKVFIYEDRFRREAIQIIKENRRNGIPARRTKGLLLR